MTDKHNEVWRTIIAKWCSLDSRDVFNSVNPSYTHLCFQKHCVEPFDVKWTSTICPATTSSRVVWESWRYSSDNLHLTVCHEIINIQMTRKNTCIQDISTESSTRHSILFINVMEKLRRYCNFKTAVVSSTLLHLRIKCQFCFYSWPLTMLIYKICKCLIF